MIKNWTSILRDLNHTNRIIDVQKMDIEGDEYVFFPSMFDSQNQIFPKQIVIELHPQNDNITHPFFQQLRNQSYVIFAKEENILAGPWFFEFDDEKKKRVSISFLIVTEIHAVGFATTGGLNGCNASGSRQDSIRNYGSSKTSSAVLLFQLKKERNDEIFFSLEKRRTTLVL